MSAPNRATTFPDTAEGRKAHPVASGVLDYFPDAIVAVAHCSFVGNEQHHPGTPLHWDRDKSTDEADALLRHFLERGTLDKDGVSHTAKMAWRALALLQKEIEASHGSVPALRRVQPARRQAARRGNRHVQGAGHRLRGVRHDQPGQTRRGKA